MLLHGKRRSFAEGIASGLAPVDAYREAYPDCKSPGAQWAAASRLLKDVKVLADVESIRVMLASLPQSRFLTPIERRNFLADVVRATPSQASPDSPLCEIKMGKEGEYYTFPDKVQCLTLDAKLAGELEPKKDAAEEAPEGTADIEAGAATRAAEVLRRLKNKKP